MEVRFLGTGASANWDVQYQPMVVTKDMKSVPSKMHSIMVSEKPCVTTDSGERKVEMTEARTGYDGLVGHCPRATR